jgi:hypothetical protein
MTVTMASGESIRIRENEGHTFNRFVYNDELDLVCKYDDLRLIDLRHPNRNKMIERNFSKIDQNCKAPKDVRRKQNMRARWSSPKQNNA